jgi:hypothetical protein
LLPFAFTQLRRLFDNFSISFTSRNSATPGILLTDLIRLRIDFVRKASHPS